MILFISSSWTGKKLIYGDRNESENWNKNGMKWLKNKKIRSGKEQQETF